MIHLLLLEWKKMKPYGTFQVLVGLYLILLPSLLMVGKKFTSLPKELGSSDIFFMFPTVWKYLGYTGNWLVFFFLGFLAVICITMEFNNKTLRQNIITGLSRTEFFQGKVVFILVVSLLATLYYTLCGLAIGFINTETIYTSKIFQEWALIPRYFLMCLGYMSFGLLIGLLVKRTGIALFLYLSYVMFIELILRYVVHMNLISNKSVHFYPMNAVEDLVPIPIPDIAKQFTSENNFQFFLSPTEAVITTVIYTTIFILSGYLLIKRFNL